MLKVLTEDQKFLNYIGKGGIDEKVVLNQSDENPKILMNKTSTSNFSQGQSVIIETQRNSINQTISSHDDVRSRTSISKNKFFPGKSKREINDIDEIIGILDDFRAAYPIGDKSKSHYALQEENKSQNNILNGTNKKFIKTFTNSFNSNEMQKQKFIGGNEGLYLLQRLKSREKQEMYWKNVYTKIIPPKQRPFSGKVVKKQQEDENLKYGPFLNSNSSKFYKKVEVTNPLVIKHLNSVNFFGPYFSYCPPCKRRNMEYYRDLEQSQCVDILKCIKKTKSKHRLLPHKKHK